MNTAIARKRDGKCLFLIIIFIVLLGGWECVTAEPVIDFQILCDNLNFKPTWQIPSTDQYVSNRNYEITFFDTNCNSSINSLINTTEANGVDKLSMTLPFNGCGTTITTFANFIDINNTAIIKVTDILRSGISERDYFHKYIMSCRLLRNSTITPSNNNGSFTVIKGVDVTKNNTISVVYGLKVSMDFYTNSALTTKQPSTAISLTTKDKVFVKIQETDISSRYRFVVNKCEAVPTLNNNTVKDTFFDNGCSLDPTFERLESASSTNDSFGFEFQVFYFRPEDSTSRVYLRCHLFVCQTESTSERCQQKCKVTGNRQRRAVTSLTRTRHDIDDVEEMTIQSPTEILLRRVVCTDIVCPANSVCYDFNPAKCVCVTGYVYSRIDEECQKDRISQIDNVHLDQTWDPVYLNTASFAFLALAEKYEDILYKSFVAAGKDRIIEGVRVIGATPGSIILETKIIYTNISSPVEAYKAFVESVEAKSLEAGTVKKELKFLPDKVPVLVMKIDKETTSIERLNMIIIIVVVFALIFFIAFFIFVAVRRRRQADNNNAYAWFR